MPQDRLFDIWFALRVGIASREFSAVLDSYESTYQLFNADAAELLFQGFIHCLKFRL